MQLDASWFTEIAPGEGIAMSLKGARRLHAERTPYQQIEIYETETFGRLMAIDGCVMLTDRDNFVYHEMLAHPALFTHPAPRDVLIIGGGDCGTLREVLKHADIGTLIQAEIDERVTRLAEQYFPELCQANHDPRARFYFGDGIQWVKEAATASLDVILIDSTDPAGPAAGLFAAAFYKECRRVLRPGGLIAQQSESPLLYAHIIKNMHAEFRQAGFAEVRTLTFPQATYPSGWWSATLAGEHGKLADFRRGDAEHKAFPTLYYDAAMHAAAFALPPFLRETLAR
ncbi:MAG: polyamine aminopropyltransferase [Gammaproteobacteria bacterium]|nr:polyamine aminopropyltransferase [Gammaproteobacteria bacterium]